MNSEQGSRQDQGLNNPTDGHVDVDLCTARRRLMVPI